MKFLTNIDKLVLSIGLVIITVSSLILYLDLNKSEKATNSKIIGEIIYKRKRAQRKFSSKVVWVDIEQNSRIYNNDSIKTSNLSEAIIKLNNGTTLELTENSLILLSLSKESIDIDFSRGSISTKNTKSKKIKIRSGSILVAFKNSDAKLSSGKNNKLDLLIENGSAKITTNDKEKIVSQNEMIIIDPLLNIISSKKKDIILKEPSNNNKFVSKTKFKNVTFSWSKKDNQKHIIEIFKNRYLNRPIVKKNVKGSKIKIKLPDGFYYWKISKKSKKKEFSSEVRRFSIIVEKPVSLILPENRKKYFFRKIKPIISFKWSKSKNTRNFRLIISKDRNMKKIIKTIELTTNNIGFDNLSIGKYYWQIISKVSFAKKTDLIKSKIFSFEIIKKREVVAPITNYPILESEFNKIIVRKNGLLFNWRKDPEILKSKLIISSSHDFKKIIFSKKTIKTFLKINKKDLFNNGTYFWKILGYINNKNKPVESNISNFKVIAPEKINIISPLWKTIFVSNKNKKIYFSWKKFEFIGNFELQLSKDKKFKKINYSRKTKKFSALLSNIKPGKYFWRVFLKDKNQILTVSDIRNFNIHDRLPSPKIVLPQKYSQIDMSKKNSLNFSWSSVEQASSYKISLYKFKKKKKYLLFNKITKNTNYIFRDLNKLDVGAFIFAVQAIKDEQRSRSISSFFYINLKNESRKKRDLDIPNIIYIEE